MTFICRDLLLGRDVSPDQLSRTALLFDSREQLDSLATPPSLATG